MTAKSLGRLQVFFRSKVLNTLSVIIESCLLLIGHTKDLTFPIACAATAFILFAAYSLWFWIKKPKRIVINNLISNINGYFTIYFLLIAALNADIAWLYTVPSLCAIPIIFIALIAVHDETIDLE